MRSVLERVRVERAEHVRVDADELVSRRHEVTHAAGIHREGGRECLATRKWYCRHRLTATRRRPCGWRANFKTFWGESFKRLVSPAAPPARTAGPRGRADAPIHAGNSSDHAQRD